MKKISLKVIITVAIVTGVVNAQKNTGLAFLKIDVDARAAAMAGAYTAVANDASAAYWNPAGLALAENMKVNGMYNDLFAGNKHGFLTTQFATGNHAMAFSFNYLNIPDIPIRETATEEPAGIVDAFTMAAAFSYATTFEDWQVGATLKYLFEKLYLVSAPGWAVDVGVLKQNFFPGIDFGLAVQNLGKMSKLEQKATRLPLFISTGMAYKIPSFLDDNLLVSLDLQWIKDEKVYSKFGMQYFITDNFVLRGGLKNGNNSLLWTGGFGINYNAFHFDYAYAPLEFYLGAFNRFSFGLNF